MPESSEALKVMRSLGEPAEMWALADGRALGDEPPKANTHVHLPANFSAFESASRAVDAAAEEGLALLGAGNYYDFSVYDEFAEAAARRRVFPLFGVEVIALVDELRLAGVRINDPDNPGKMYICGKGLSRFVRMSAAARELMTTVRGNDAARAAAMIARLNRTFRSGGVALGVDEAAVIDMVAGRSGRPSQTVTLQERHVALAFQEAFFESVPENKRRELLTRVFGEPPKAGGLDEVRVQNEIRARLMKAGRPAFVEEKFLRLDDACRLVLELGGIPCYPTLADGAADVCEFERPVEGLVERITQRNFHCAEFIPVRNRVDVLERYVRAVRAAGLAVTAGTEHNTLGELALEPTAARGEAIPRDVRRIFWEGACVAAAHQFLGAHGQPGFVDETGRPNADYGGAEERINAFARLGAALIERFRAGAQGH